MDNLANAIEEFLDSNIGFHDVKFKELCDKHKITTVDLEKALDEINSSFCK